ncbi:MAG: ATP-binding protein, partial [Coriobacteriia bacterium]|nr:ATP-binding protein [Coriobacteriia bacterium]
AKDAPRIFDEFYQAGASPSLKPPGTGLGLPISRSLARLLGGDVGIESTGPDGSVFVLRIPSEYDESQI